MPNPETIRAVTAEMRMRARCHSNAADILDWAVRVDKALDRLEAAVARERNAHTNDVHDALYMATGIPSNAAAMRAALENVKRVARFCAETPRHTSGYPTDAARADVLYSRIAELGRVAHAALAAPARNCDRFADPGKAWLAYKAECDKNETVPNMIGAISWLLAPAEGGDHA